MILFIFFRRDDTCTEKNVKAFFWCPLYIFFLNKKKSGAHFRCSHCTNAMVSTDFRDLNKAQQCNRMKRKMEKMRGKSGSLNSPDAQKWEIYRRIWKITHQIQSETVWNETSRHNKILEMITIKFVNHHAWLCQIKVAVISWCLWGKVREPFWGGKTKIRLCSFQIIF